MAKGYIRTYYFIEFFSTLSVSFFFATYAVFLFANGLNVMQIGIIASISTASVIIFEVPTGAFADSYGRKISIIAGFVLISVATGIYFISKSFEYFIVAEIIAGLGIVFVSGALDAWIVDSLRNKGPSESIGKIFARGMQANQAGMILGSLSGAYIGSINIALPWAASSLFCMSLAIICAFIMKEEYEICKKRKLMEIMKVATEGIRFSIRNKDIMYVVFFGAAVFFSSKALDIQWSLVFRYAYSLDMKYLGWIVVGFSLFMMAGAQVSIRLMKNIGINRRTIVLSQGLTIFGTLIASLMLGVIPVLSGIFIQEIGRGAIIPLRQAYFSKEGRIPSDKRATVLSFDSMVLSIGGIFGLMASGYLADAYSISIAWMVSGLALLICSIVFLRLQNGK